MRIILLLCLLLTSAVKFERVARPGSFPAPAGVSEKERFEGNTPSAKVRLNPGTRLQGIFSTASLASSNAGSRSGKTIIAWRLWFELPIKGLQIRFEKCQKPPNWPAALQSPPPEPMPDCVRFCFFKGNTLIT